MDHAAPLGSYQPLDRLARTNLLSSHILIELELVPGADGSLSTAVGYLTKTLDTPNIFLSQHNFEGRGHSVAIPCSGINVGRLIYHHDGRELTDFTSFYIT